MSRYLIVLPSDIEGHEDVLDTTSRIEADRIAAQKPGARIIDVSDGPVRLRLGYWKDDA